MIFIKLDNLETVNKLVNVCTRYKEEAYIDVIYGRYILDACSVLGVSSLMGNIVKIKPNTNDTLLLEYLRRDLEEIGAWTQKTN
jgi:hypothetical protein